MDCNANSNAGRKPDHVKLGYAPTRRSIFSAPDALKYRALIKTRLEELGVDLVDIDDINDEGLLYADTDLPAIAGKFKAAGIDGLFLPHCNFGTEYAAARLAREMGVPVLLWGPRDESPDEKGIRLRDSQCGLFATGKVLRRFQTPFTYMTNCRPEDPEFRRGIHDFLRVCNVVRTFRHTRILQISTRPFDFLTTMCSEGELLEKFNIQLAPIPMTELAEAVRAARGTAETAETIAYIKENMDIRVDEETVRQTAALKNAMGTLASKYQCNAVAIQCWNALQTEIGIMPCAANSLLTGDGIPVVCETDIHGAVTSLLVQAAAMGERPILFADWTVRHPENENGELLQHCGPWPLSAAKAKPALSRPLVFDFPGAVAAEARHGELTLARFDGDNGEYSLLLGTARAIDGPYTLGTYLWIEVENWKRLEAKLVEGPYIHHCTGIHGDVVPILYEACKYIGVKPDLYDNNEEQIKAYLRGE
jgi:L-fucose isomerase-like protein